MLLLAQWANRMLRPFGPVDAVDGTNFWFYYLKAIKTGSNIHRLNGRSLALVFE